MGGTFPSSPSLLFPRMPPQEADDAAFRAGGFGEDFVCQLKTFGAQRLLPLDDRIEKQGEPFAIAETFRLPIGDGCKDGEIMFMAEYVDQPFGIGPFCAHGGGPDAAQQA